MSATQFDVVGIGNALVDVIAHADDHGRCPSGNGGRSFVKHRAPVG